MRRRAAAAEPTPNPHPQKFSQLKITVEPGSGVTGVSVESLWNVGNIGCAPHQGWPSGTSITKQVNTPEKVKQVDTDEWVATLVDGRFLPDKCRWYAGGYSVRFVHNDVVLASDGSAKQAIEEAGVLKLTCETDTHLHFLPICRLRDQEAFLRARYPVFNATLEIVK
ncbi:MAG TPA: hypothetical protein VJ862_12350 [Rhodanobacteraceae bacterium]|nr:hypothetical protein [Rhodanobacteraceae bacterium]